MHPCGTFRKVGKYHVADLEALQQGIQQYHLSRHQDSFNFFAALRIMSGKSMKRSFPISYVDSDEIKDLCVFAVWRRIQKPDVTSLTKFLSNASCVDSHGDVVCGLQPPVVIGEHVKRFNNPSLVEVLSWTLHLRRGPPALRLQLSRGTLLWNSAGRIHRVIPPYLGISRPSRKFFQNCRKSTGTSPS